MEHNVSPIPLCLHPSDLSLLSPLNKTNHAQTSLQQTCVSILIVPSQSWVNLIGYMVQCSSTMIYQGSVAFYTLKVEFARWTKSDKKKRACTISKTGKLNKNIAQMIQPGEMNKAVRNSCGFSSMFKPSLFERINRTHRLCQTFKTIGCTSFQQSSNKWDPIVTFIRQSATLVLHLMKKK